ncbi:hypothetical protein [Streptomyces sp. NPDC060366]|uniref:hypothetical protein n=1 Tax=Streptomyces sp. NPDC060366 TaxID=3347105 RepID=UPI003653C0ED
MSTSRPTPEYGLPALPISSPGSPTAKSTDYESYRARQVEYMAYIASLPLRLAIDILNEQYELDTLPDYWRDDE